MIDLGGEKRAAEIDYAARARNMLALYEEGLTASEIGRRYGITRERVRQILEPYRVIKARRQKQREKSQSARESRSMRIEADRQEFQRRLAQVVNLVREGASVRESAKALHVSREKAYAAVKSAGVVIHHGRWRDLSNAESRAMSLVEKGLSAPAIARKLAEEGEFVSVPWIYRRFAKAIRARRKHANDNLTRFIAA